MFLFKQVDFQLPGRSILSMGATGSHNPISMFLTGQVSGAPMDSVKSKNSCRVTLLSRVGSAWERGSRFTSADHWKSKGPLTWRIIPGLVSS